MKDQRTVHPPLWISETDEHGNRVRREVVEAAHRIWNRVLQHLQYAGQDIAPAAETLEVACHCVSRAVSRNLNRNSIRNLDSYLFWAFIRKHNAEVQFANGAKKARSRLQRAGLDRIGRGQP